ncbi:MAG: hypothetical protein R3F59_37455 [Myxococcota bacterium]
MGRRGRPGMGMRTGPALRGGRRQQRGGLGEKAREQLQQARALAEAGKFAEAAASYDRMAGIARERDMPRMASTLSAKAAQNHAKAGDRQGLVASTEAAIGDAKQEGDAGHAARTFGDLVGSLGGTSFASAAPDIEGAIRQALGVSPAAAPTPEASGLGRSQRRNLPTACDACGAPVSAGDLRFDERGDADCPYCGSILTA